MAQDGSADLETLFAEAVDLPPAERSRFLDDRCRDQPGLREDIDSLLAAHARAGAFLDNPAADIAGGAGPDDAERTLGPFRLIDVIGRGASGVVYRAERVEGDFTQRVAVKVIDAPLASGEVLRRFRAERQILATLQHANIVTLIDGGLAGDGRPYLVMELVEGEPITRHCAERRSSLPDRLRLVQQVCSAVQYAHQHAVIHRDLKPGNILVTADGLVKVLDFGIAKLVDASTPAADATLTAGPRALTPNYASPEQLRGLPVTSAADLYALGILLYELVAGVRPYETASRPLDEVLRLVTTDTPRRPSAAPARDLPYDRGQLRGDLDAIVLKAMDKEPARRYASAQELSQDLDRWLNRLPVLAREPSLPYLIAKAARRHRAAFAAAAVAAVAVLVGLGVSLKERRVAIGASARATARFNDVRQIANALIFQIDAAIEPLPGSTPVRRQIVSQALTYLERLTGDPDRDDALSLEIGRAYHRIGDVQGNPSLPNLGDGQGALESYRKGIAVLRPIAAGPRASRDAALEIGRVSLTLANVATFIGRAPEADAAVREAADIGERLRRANPHDDAARRLVGSAEFQAAIALSDDEALPHWQRAGDVFGELLAEQPADPDRRRNVALVEKYIGAIYGNRSDFTTALTHFTRAQVLDGQRLAASPADRSARFDVAIDLANVAGMHWHLGHRPEAADEFEQSLALRQAIADSDPKDVQARSRVVYVQMTLARLYDEMQRTTDALAHARPAAQLAESMAALDATHAEEYADALEALGDAERDGGDRVSACQVFARSRDLARATLTHAALSPATQSSLDTIISGDTSRLAGCPVK